MNEIILKPGEGILSDYFLDNFVAYDLSKLKVCCFPNLSIEYNKWLNHFILNSAFKYKLENPIRRNLFNFVRKTQNAIISYEIGKNSLDEYLMSPRNTISPYFISLFQFENCIGQCYEASRFIKAILNGEKLFDTDDGSVLSKINNIHNTSKHMDERIINGKMPEAATIPIWISNDGIEIKDIVLKGTELSEYLIDSYNLSEKLCNPEKYFNSQNKNAL